MSSATSHDPIATASPGPQAWTRVRHVILDRDGVLNREAPDGGYVNSPGGWAWLPGALEGLVALHRAGVRVSIATNQSGVGRGLMTRSDLDAVHARMIAEAAEAGARIHAIFYCPHAPEEGCRCRKPAPALIERAVAASGILADQTLAVGDDLRDLQASAAAGVPAALVLTGKGGRTLAQLRGRPVAVYENLGALARVVVAETQSMTDEVS